MRKWDKEYITLCKKILKEGKRVENRTGIDSIKIPAYTLEFDLSKEFPALTTKQLFFRQAIVEMLWIYQVQSNDVRWLQDRNVHIWDEWIVDENGDGTYKLQDKGVTIFQEGVKIEKGIESSKAADRTIHRHSRRHYFRRKLRKIEVIKVLSENGLCPAITKEELDNWRYKREYPLVDEFIKWQRTNDNEEKNPYHDRYICLNKKLNLKLDKIESKK